MDAPGADAAARPPDAREPGPMDMGAGGVDAPGGRDVPAPIDMASPDTGPSCPVGNSLCGDRCVDTTRDRAHCGACGMACAMGPCAEGRCQCTNRMRDGEETDVDCGGPCGRCSLGGLCRVNSDCEMGVACISGRCLPPNGLSAFYDLEQAGPMILDGSPNANHGTASGAMRVPGKVGNGYRFGDGSCIRVPDSASLSRPSQNALTLMAWVRYTGACESDRGIIVNKEVQYELGVNCMSNAFQDAINTSATAWQWFGTVVLRQDTWHHVAATWDGAVVRQYVDGVEVGMRPLTGNQVDRSTGVGIGCRRVSPDGQGQLQGSPSHFVGVIDEVAIYGRALSAAELRAYHAATR